MSSTVPAFMFATTDEPSSSTAFNASTAAMSGTDEFSMQSLNAEHGEHRQVHLAHALYERLIDNRSIILHHVNTSSFRQPVTNQSFPVQKDNSTSFGFLPFLPGLNMPQLVLILMCIFIVLMVLLIAVILKLRSTYANWKRRKAKVSVSITSVRNGANHSKSPSKASRASRGSTGNRPTFFRNNLISRMIARIDEFDSLTPLVVTPGSGLGDDEPYRFYFKNGRPMIHYKVPNNSLQIEAVGTDEHQPLIEMTKAATMKNGGSHHLMHELTEYPQIHSSALNHPGAQHFVNVNVIEESDIVSIDRTSANSTLEKRITRRIIQSDEPLPFYQTTNQSCGSDLQFHCSLSDYLPSDDNLSVKNNNNVCSLQASSLVGSNTATSFCMTMPDLINQNLSYPQQGSSSAGTSDDNDNNRKPKSAFSKLFYPKHNGATSTALRQTSDDAKNNNNANGLGNNVLPGSMPTSSSAICDETRSAASVSVKSSRRSASNDSICSNLSSPLESSVGGDTGSPIDTTGSIGELSDSNYNASESDTSEAKPGKWFVASSTAVPGTSASIAEQLSGVLASCRTSATSGDYELPSEPSFSGKENQQQQQQQKHEPVASAASLAASTFARRFHLHSIQEEDQEEEAAGTSRHATAAGAIYAKGSSRTGTDESLSVLSREGPKAGEDFEKQQQQASATRRFPRKPFRGRQKAPAASTSKKTTVSIALPPPPPMPQSSSIQVLSGMLQHGGKLNTGSMPSWFPKRENAK